MWRGKELTGKVAKCHLSPGRFTQLSYVDSRSSSTRQGDRLDRVVARVEWFVPLVDPRVGLLQFADA